MSNLEKAGSRPRLLDLFCGAGGAAMGYHRAGWDVTGVDIAPQPRYPFAFWQGDAMELLKADWIRLQFEAIHASPPCQGYSPHVSSTDSEWVPTRGKNEPRLIESVRSLMVATGLPWVIENVYGARGEMEFPILLCGASFGLPIARHRLFESNHPLVAPIHLPCKGVARRYAMEHGIEYRDMSVTGKGRHAGTSDRWRTFLGVDWPTTQAELSEMIPPTYTEFVGEQLLAAMEVAA